MSSRSQGRVDGWSLAGEEDKATADRDDYAHLPPDHRWWVDDYERHRALVRPCKERQLAKRLDQTFVAGDPMPQMAPDLAESWGGTTTTTTTTTALCDTYPEYRDYTYWHREIEPALREEFAQREMEVVGLGAWLRDLARQIQKAIAANHYHDIV
jgi:hypothetical protein